MERYQVVVNPEAGKGAAGRRLPRLRALLEGCGLDCSIELTKSPWHAAEIARRAVLDGYTVVAAAGGDGTSNEVLNGLMAARPTTGPAPALAVLPVGRGNDFAFGVGVPRDLDAAVAVLAHGRRRPLDVGRITGGAAPAGRYFGNGVGIGFDTIVGLEAARQRWLTGAAAYAWAALKTIVTYSGAPLVRLELEGRQIVQRSVMISLMNGRRLGGAFLMAPAAATDDGLLDLCMAGEPGRLAMLRLFGSYVRGTQSRSRFVTTGRAREIGVEAVEGSLAVHADGETICTAGTAIRVECLARQLEVLVPAESAGAAPPPVGPVERQRLAGERPRGRREGG